MSGQKDDELQVIITSGLEAPDRAVAGFALALAAASSGSRVVVWLTMRGANWAVRTQGNQADVPGFSPIAEYIRLLLESGARIELCSTCGDNACMLQGIKSDRSDLREQITLAGMAKPRLRTYWKIDCS